MGEQLTAQYRKAQSAQLEIITFGAMLIDAEAAICATRGTVSSIDREQLTKVEVKHIGGSSAKGQGLKGWLAQYAPEVTYGTARRYRDIAEALVGHLHLKSTEQLKLLTATDATLDEKLAKKRAELLDLVTEKSVRGIQLELGLRDEPALRGGAREKKPSSEGDESEEVPVQLEIPANWFWVTPQQRAHFSTLTENERQAWIVWGPRLHDLSNDLHSSDPMWARLDSTTKGDLALTLTELLAKIQPGRR